MASFSALLRSIPLFQDLSQDETAQIRSIATLRTYRKKTVIFTEGDQKEAVYFIQQGLVKAYKTDEQGNEHIVSFLKTGDMFPHTGFFSQQHIYPATAETIVDTEIIAIATEAFEHLLLDIPSIAIKVMKAMSQKIIELQEKLQQITGSDVHDRGLSFLIHLAENHGTDRNGAVHIHVPMTHQEFANTIGTTRETANRLINQLRKEGLIETNRHGFIIHDLAALKGWLHK